MLIVSCNSRMFSFHNFMYPALQLHVPPTSASIGDQYAFRPTGSTTAAVIDLFQNLSNLLKDNDYVVLISIDFSRAFFTARNSTLMQKILPMDIRDNIIIQLARNYFADLGHVTKLWDIISQVAFINASIDQGSVIGPTSYVIVASGLRPIHQYNKMMKYADDTYLIVGSRHISTANEEFENISRWA